MFAVGPHPWMHYKYADQYRPYNIDEEFHAISSSSRVLDKDRDKKKSSAHPVRKEAKTEAKHDKSHKHISWVKTKEVAEHVKDGIAKSVELTLGNVASCVAKPGGDDSTDVVDGGKITSIKENYVPEVTESDLHGVFDANTKTWDDIKEKIDCTPKQSKEFPGVDLDENKACHSGSAEHRDEKRKKSFNLDEITHFGFGRHRHDKKKKSKSVDYTEDTEFGLHGVFDASTKTWDDIKAKVDATLKQSKEFPGVDFDENKACHSGFAGHRDEKRKKSLNLDENTHFGFRRHRLFDKKKKSKSVDYPEGTEFGLHGVFDASTRTWDDIKAKVDSTIKQNKIFPGVDLDENKTCHSGSAEHLDEKRKNSITVDVPENTHTGFLRYRNDKRKKSIEKAKVERELKNIANCILGNFDDEVDNKWDDIKARTDVVLENSKKVTDKDFENANDLGENRIQQEKDPTISLTEKEVDSVNRDLATIWKVEEKFKITEDDIVGSAPENLNFVIKGGVNIVHATMPDVFEVRSEAIAATSWNTTVHSSEEVDDDPLDVFVMDDDVCSGARLNRDMDAIVADLRYI